MEERKEEIAGIMSVIQTLCVSAQIGLIAKSHNGVLYVAIQDATNGKEYVITRKETENE